MTPWRKPSADSTEEVQVEDILLEAYAEEPPPPLPRRTPQAPPSDSARASIAMAIASAVPPPAQGAAVDALLRASDPAFAPYPQQQHHSQYPQYSQYPQAPRYSQYESVSVAPVMLATTVPPPARPVFANARAKRANRAAAIAVWASVLLVLGIALGGAVVLGVKNGTYARLRDGARTKSAPVAAAAAPAPAPAPAPEPASLALPDTQVVAPPPPAPAAPAAPAPVAEAEATIPPDSSLVTFPPFAQGHRIFIDGRIVAVAAGEPTKLKCGRHMVKLGSARKARVYDFACGREVVLK